MHTPPPRPLDDEERLEVLRRYRILDTDPEAQFDRIAEIAKRQFGVPIAFVAFLDEERNFLKARGDLPMSESPRDISFCGHTILTDDVLVVPDATLDDRFRENPLVTGDHHLRFYAGAPLKTDSGHRIGTVCVFDVEGRQFSEEDRRRLQDLAAIVSDHLEMRLAVGDVHDEIETRKRAEAEADRRAYFDALTGIPNRNAFNRFAAGAVAKPGLTYALYGDLDSFKQANDALGHHTADEILVRTGARMLEVLGDDAFIARISGDEFVAILEQSSEEAVERLANDILHGLGDPILVDGHLFVPGISFGIAKATEPGESINELLNRADVALLKAKQAGGSRVSWYDRDMAELAARRNRLSMELRRAIAEGDIKVVYQTIHDAADGSVIGVEALARWTHPQLGPIGPDEFIPIAEESGLVTALGDHVLRTAVADVMQWPDLFVAVNVSPLQFHLGNLPEEIIAYLEEAGLPPARLQLEVTENLLLQDVDLARRQIAALRAAGIRVALDDFGTGYSSLSYLKTIPFDKLKIDRSFVMGLDSNPVNAAIVQHIIHLARDLKMRVTAEGVETGKEEVLLRLAGCNSFQGYRFGRPGSAADVNERLASRPRRPSGGAPSERPGGVEAVQS